MKRRGSVEVTSVKEDVRSAQLERTAGTHIVRWSMLETDVVTLCQCDSNFIVSEAEGRVERIARRRTSHNCMRITVTINTWRH